MHKKKDIFFVQNELNIKILTPEGEILFLLSKFEHATASDIIKKSKYSHGCIFQKIKDLDAAGLVMKVRPVRDRPTSHITLSPHAREMLLEHI